MTYGILSTDCTIELRNLSVADIRDLTDIDILSRTSGCFKACSGSTSYGSLLKKNGVIRMKIERRGEQSRAEQKRAEQQSRAEERRGKENRAEQKRTEQSTREQSRATEQSREQRRGEECTLSVQSPIPSG